MTEKRVIVKLSQEAEESYKLVVENARHSKEYKSILNSIDKKKDLIIANPLYGDKVRKELIPKEYVEKYQINNLYRVELSDYWRMEYTLVNSPEGEVIEVIAFVLDIMNHDKYNKKQGYK